MARPEGSEKTCSGIYRQQNTILHRAFAKLGLPYEENKSLWLNSFGMTVGRPVSGLTDMTLGERDMVIKDLAARCSIKVFNPGIPARMRGWKKGEPELSYRVREEHDDQVAKIMAIWVDLGYEPEKIRGLVRSMYKVEDVRWLSPDQRANCIQYLTYRRDGIGKKEKVTRKMRNGAKGGL